MLGKQTLEGHCSCKNLTTDSLSWQIEIAWKDRQSGEGKRNCSKLKLQGPWAAHAVNGGVISRARAASLLIGQIYSTTVVAAAKSESANGRYARLRPS